MSDEAKEVKPEVKPAAKKKAKTATITVVATANIKAADVHISQSKVSVPHKWAGPHVYIDIPDGEVVKVRASNTFASTPKMVTGVASMQGADIEHGELVCFIEGPKTVFHGDVLGTAVVVVETEDV